MTEEISFKEKLKSIQWSPAVRNPDARKNYYDADALKDSLLDANKEEEMAQTHGVGFMRRDKNGEFYRKDKITGDYIKADRKDIDRAIGGGPSLEERSRSFGVGGKPGSGSSSSGS